MAKDNVVVLPCTTTLDIPPDRVLDGAKDSNLSNVIVIGVEDDGTVFFSSSTADAPKLLWFIEKAKNILMGLK